jgi:hypothetical protein
MLSALHKQNNTQDATVPTVSAAAHQLAHLIMTTTTASIMTQKTPMLTFWLDKLFSTVKPPEVERRSNSTMLKKETNSDKTTKARRRLSYAETLRCTEAASLATPAHTLMVPINFRRRLISQATS